MDAISATSNKELKTDKIIEHKIAKEKKD